MLPALANKAHREIVILILHACPGLTTGCVGWMHAKIAQTSSVVCVCLVQRCEGTLVVLQLSITIAWSDNQDFQL